MTESDMNWDLSPMVNGAGAKEVEELLASQIERAEALASKLVLNIDQMSCSKLSKLLQEMESLQAEIWDVNGYCELRYWADSTDTEAARLANASQIARSKLDQALTPAKIRLGELVCRKPEIKEHEELRNYRHYLERLSEQAPYSLSDGEERLVVEKDTHGINLLSRLRGAWLSKKTIDIEVNGISKSMLFSELSSMVESSSRETRRNAAYALYRGLANDALIYSYAFRSVCANHVNMCRRRGLPSAMTRSLLDEDVDRSTIDMMLSTIETTSNSFHEYIKVKTEMMGLEKLTDFDLYGPLTNEQTWTFTWSEAKKAVIESYYAFDEIAGSVVRNMFRNRRIDAANRSGKNSWAYSWGWPRGQSSFITFTFNGNLHDVYTLAHENGHSVQTHLTYLAQTPFNCLTSSCLSEMGSIFGELLLTDKLLGVAKTDSRYRNLLNHVLGGFYFHVYHISARTFFEQSIYDYVADGGLLDDEAICMLWTKARERIFGDYIEWSRYSEYEWARTPHNFLPLYRFYNYPYSFGQLLVYALYEDYKTHSESFTTRFKKLLSNGSSMKPQDQLFEFGYDISKRSFWKRGIRQADKFLRELKTMT